MRNEEEIVEKMEYVLEYVKSLDPESKEYMTALGALGTLEWVLANNNL